MNFFIIHNELMKFLEKLQFFYSIKSALKQRSTSSYAEELVQRVLEQHLWSRYSLIKLSIKRK